MLHHQYLKMNCPDVQCPYNLRFTRRVFRYKRNVSDEWLAADNSRSWSFKGSHSTSHCCLSGVPWPSKAVWCCWRIHMKRSKFLIIPKKKKTTQDPHLPLNFLRTLIYREDVPLIYFIFWTVIVFTSQLASVEYISLHSELCWLWFKSYRILIKLYN